MLDARGAGGAVITGAELVDAAAAVARRTPVSPASSRDSPIPFEDLLVPFVQVARCLTWPKSPARAMLTSSARRDLERSLTARLSRIADRSLFAEFSLFRREAASGGRGAVLPQLDAGSRRQYDAFVTATLADGFARVRTRYPMLARLLASTVTAWSASTLEMVERLARDRDAIARMVPAASGRVRCVAAELSDLHCGGRSVARLQFTGGGVVVYKPRDVTLEIAASKLVSWVNERSSGPRVKLPHLLGGDGYGWAECIDERPCRDAGERRLYFHRAGQLLCLAYVFGASDLHSTNVIASGPFPVPVDLEVFMAAGCAAGTAGHGGLGGGLRRGWDSVLRTGLLPSPRPGPAGDYRRDGGLVRRPASSHRRWVAPNTDWMALTPAAAGGQRPRAAPELDRAREHVEDLLAGFTAAYSLVEQHRHDLLEDQGPLSLFDTMSYRVVLRNTRTYATLIERLVHPGRLGAECEWVGEASRLPPLDVVAAPLVAVAEYVALAQLDVPIFWAGCADRTLRASGFDAIDTTTIAESGITGARRRIARLDPHDLLAQQQAIRLALARADTEAPRGSAMTDLSLADWCRERAGAIADRLTHAVYADLDGHPSWVAAVGGTATVGRLATLGWDLYGGRAGVALFLAAHAATSGDSEMRQFVARLLAPLAEASTSVPAGGGVGVGTGLGGVVYALARCAGLLSNADGDDHAVRAARGITPEAIAGDQRRDLVFGSAGAVVGLLAVYDRRPEGWLLDAADRCARHAVEPMPPRAPGMAHGRAGVAYALARLFDVTRKPWLRRTVIDLWRQEQASTDTSLPNSWCRGDAGTGLARLACASLIGSAELRDPVIAAAERAAGALGIAGTPDHLCCGTLGVVAFLQQAARTFERREWQEAADGARRAIVARAVARSTYQLGVPDDIFAPGLFQGLAGVGYEMLRYAAPELPLVLMVE